MTHEKHREERYRDAHRTVREQRVIPRVFQQEAGEDGGNNLRRHGESIIEARVFSNVRSLGKLHYHGVGIDVDGRPGDTRQRKERKHTVVEGPKEHRRAKGKRQPRHAAENGLAPADALAQRRYRQFYWGPIHLAERCNHTKWSVLRYPNDAMAQLAGMSTEEYEDFYFRACLVDYDKMGRAMEPLQKWMARTDKVHILGPGTDLTFSIKGIPSFGMHGNRNIPDGEIYTSPVRESVNGRITYNCPSPYDGFLFRDVCLEFRDGKIVEATSNNTPYMNEIFDIDEGARYVGEFAFGVNPVITKPIGDILFDEKIAGSFHLTPGNSYDNASNGNHSAVHWDLIQIQTPEYGGGEIWFDDVLIRKDGLFVPEELQCLNPENLLSGKE